MIRSHKPETVDDWHKLFRDVYESWIRACDRVCAFRDVESPLKFRCQATKLMWFHYQRMQRISRGLDTVRQERAIAFLKEGDYFGEKTDGQ